ncbi:unnamed protein product [Prunus armeniaca]
MRKASREVELNPKGSEQYKILTIPPAEVREIQLSTKNSLHKHRLERRSGFYRYSPHFLVNSRKRDPEFFSTKEVLRLSSTYEGPNSSNGNGEEFINEVGTMGHIHHVNVVHLVGFCADGFRRALVYEFSNACKITFHQQAKRMGSLVGISCKILP